MPDLIDDFIRIQRALGSGRELDLDAFESAARGRLGGKKNSYIRRSRKGERTRGGEAKGAQT